MVLYKRFEVGVSALGRLTRTPLGCGAVVTGRRCESTLLVAVNSTERSGLVVFIASTLALVVACLPVVATATSTTTFALDQTLLPPSGASDLFGSAVAASGDVLVVGGMRSATSGGTGAFDSVYIYEWSGSTWSFQQEIAPWGTTRGKFYGGFVDTDGERVVVRAFRSIWVYKEVSGVWTLEANLAPTPPVGHVFSDQLRTVDLEGDRIVAGMPKLLNPITSTTLGSAFVFERGASGWTQTATILPVDPGASPDFGTDVALDGDLVVVGDPGATPLGVGAGAAYIYEENAGAWVPGARLARPGTFGLGSSVDADAGRIVVTTRFDTLLSDTYVIDVFERTGPLWIHETTLSPIDAETDRSWSKDLDLEAGRIVAGSIDATGTSGLVSIFELCPGGWQELSQSPLSTGAADYGWGVDLVGDQLVVAEAVQGSGRVLIYEP